MIDRLVSRWNGLAPLAQGALLFLTAIFLFSIMDSIAKELAQRHHSLQVVWARYTSQTFWAFLLLAPRLSTLLRTKYFGLQIVRSAFLFFATMCFFTSIKFMSLASTTAIFETAPLFMTIAAFFILKESVGPRRWIGVAIGMIGALIIIRPGSDVFTIVSILPLLAALGFTGYAISTRFLGREESPWTSFLYTALIGTIVSFFIIPFVWEMPQTSDALMMSGMGIIGGAGHIVLIRAFTITEASYLAPFGYFALIFNTFWGFLLFAEIPDAATIMGASVIVTAGIYVWYRERNAAAPPKV